jgi:hypothetical protein
MIISPVMDVSDRCSIKSWRKCILFDVMYMSGELGKKRKVGISADTDI